MLRFHNTLTGTIDDFSPMTKGEVKMFVCGPTVYDFSHIGHAKTYIQFDVLARTFRYLGYKTTYLQNITDIDDRIITRAREKSTAPEALAREYEQYYLEDMQALNNTSVNTYARALDYIPQIVDQVKRLVDKGFAYKITDGYYFDIKSFKDYGKLSGRTALAPNDSVSRIDENHEKRNPGDFCLWKFKKEGDPSWSTEIGDGRPGWHIEDTAITETEFGPQYDLHGGAVDLIFPHHEAEIAQMESASGKSPLVRYWLHTGFLNIKSEKMSKSTGNFITIRNIFKEGVSPLALRYFFLSAHYRSQINFTDEALEAAQNAYRKLKEFVGAESELGVENVEYERQFREALENDLNTPEALAVTWNLVKDNTVASADKRTTLLKFDQVLGLKLDHNEFAVTDIPSEVQALLKEREVARTAEDFARSDELRTQIKILGYHVNDTASGQQITRL